MLEDLILYKAQSKYSYKVGNRCNNCRGLYLRRAFKSDDRWGQIFDDMTCAKCQTSYLANLMMIQHVSSVSGLMSG